MNTTRSLLLGETAGKETVSLATPPFCYEGSGSLLTICADEQLKDSHLVIPNLLRYSGSVIVLDPAGKYYEETSTKRKELGHKIILLDPFGLTPGNSDTFNPLDIMFHNEALMHEAVSLIAENFITGQSLKSIFWNNDARDLLVGVLLYFATVKKEECNLEKVIELLSHDEVVYELSLMLDVSGKAMSPSGYTYISHFLEKGDVLRGEILSCFLEYSYPFSSSLYRRNLGSTSFDLQGLLDGNLFTVYIILPVSKSRLHSILAKLWLSSFAFLLQETEHAEKLSTLVILDSLSISSQPYLQDIHKYATAGSNLQLWAFWKNIFELQDCYPEDWKIVLINSAVLHLVGPYDFLSFKALCDSIPIDADNISANTNHHIITY